MKYPTKKLGELCEVFTDGDWIESKDQSTQGIRLIQTGNIGRGVFLNKVGKARFISESTFKKLNCTEIVPGDLLISRLPDPVGRSCIIPDIKSKMVTAVDCTIVRVNEKIIIRDFLLLYTNSSEYFLQIQAQLSGTTRKRISRGNLSKIEIPLPPLSEQKKIVAKLEKMLAKISEAKKLRAEAQEAANQLLPAELHKIFEEGKKQGWEEKELEEVAESIADGTHDTPRYQDDGFPLITSKNLRPEGLTFDTAKFISDSDYEQINKRSHVSNGDILIGMIGTIGNVTRVNTDKKFSIKNIGLVRPDEKQVLGQYITYYLDNSRLKSLIVTGGTTQKFMALGTLRRIKVIYPSLSEQKKIVARLNSIFEKAKHLQEHQKATSNDLHALEQSILSKAFSGKFV